MIQLDIISDPICPWCYIGKTKLDRALEGIGANPFDITWRPYQLNPDMPSEGMDRRAYLDAKFGKEDAPRIYGQIEEAARGAGLDVDFSAIKRTPNTIDAHRVIRWAKTTGHQSLLVSELFDRYFKRGEDISDHQVLADSAAEIGMEREIVTRLLSGDADRAEVQTEDAEARRMGVRGVPTFIVASQYALTGAQDSEVWKRVVEELTSRVST